MNMADLQLFAKSPWNNNLVICGDQILATDFKIVYIAVPSLYYTFFDVYIALNESFEIPVQI